MKTQHVPFIMKAALALATTAAACQSAQDPATPPYMQPNRPVEQRVDDLLGRMTPQEKANMLAGEGWMESQPNTRLGIPSIKMADGPAGVRNWTGPSAVTMNVGPTFTSTAFPAGICLASSWDVDLAGQIGRAIAQEVKAFGRDMILGPTVNINRVPLWGRNFEGYGEDPYLAARLAVAYVKAVQAEGVIPSVKHFAANNQEFERHRIDEKIDVRALNEIYFPAFKAAVQEGGAWAVMSAYNKVNGQWCAENPFLLTETLQKAWGFKGFVISDWGSTYSTAGTINAGMNLEMPGGHAMRHWLAEPQTQKDGNGAGWLTEDKVLAAVASGEVKQEAVDDSVRRILRVMFTAGLFDAPHTPGGATDTAEQRAVARAAATEGVVLLKNRGGLLPLAANRGRSVAVIGPSAANPRAGGGGSSYVISRYSVTALEGIKEAAGPGVRVEYALGAAMQGEDPKLEEPTAAAVLRKQAAELAARCDVAVVVVGNSRTIESEGFDRASMDLPANQDELIAAVSAANPNTIVVLIAGAPVTMTRWVEGVPAVVCSWYGGQEAGHAIGDVLFGLANPSGKTPVTFPKRLEEATAFGNYPGEGLHVAYAEGIYVGYRGFEKHGVEPLFPFGHGLSYTRFEYSDLKVSPAAASAGQSVQVRFAVRNAGPLAGAEIVQLYVTDPHASIDRPPKELKGFSRVLLAPGQSQIVTLVLDPAAMSFFDPARDTWVAEPGAFGVLVGASSADIRLRGSFDLLK
jgi:beta-glucosidase